MEEEEVENRTLNEVVESILIPKIKKGKIKMDDLDGYTIEANELKEFEDELPSIEPFKTAEKVSIVDEPSNEDVSMFLSSNASFVGDVKINSIQLTTKTTNLNEIIQDSNLYEPVITPTIYDNRGYKPTKYMVMKMDDEIDIKKAKESFEKAINGPDNFVEDERYMIVRGQFETINTPYNRDYSFKIKIS